jgi:hypothetical protein
MRQDAKEGIDREERAMKSAIKAVEKAKPTEPSLLVSTINFIVNVLTKEKKRQETGQPYSKNTIDLALKLLDRADHCEALRPIAGTPYYAEKEKS